MLISEAPETRIACPRYCVLYVDGSLGGLQMIYGIRNCFDEWDVSDQSYGYRNRIGQGRLNFDTKRFCTYVKDISWIYTQCSTVDYFAEWLMCVSIKATPLLNQTVTCRLFGTQPLSNSIQLLVYLFTRLLYARFSGIWIKIQDYIHSRNSIWNAILIWQSFHIGVDALI